MKNCFPLILSAPLLIASAPVGTFPEIEDGWLDAPEVISVETVKGVLTGMTKHQVYHRLGEPHFNEGIGARTWNYMFDMRAAGQRSGMTCSVQLVYEDGRVARIQWQKPSCADAAK